MTKCNRITSDKAKQPLPILKWQTLVCSGKDNDKMDVIFQCPEIFYKFECSGKDYVEAFNIRVQITKERKNVKEVKETKWYLFLLFFLGLFYLVLL